MRSAVTALMLLAAAGCAASVDGPPEILVDASACSHCGMLISEPVFAAAYRAQGKEARVFDDIGCLIEAARKETTGTVRFWFHDAAGEGWIDGSAATFVASPAIRTPMGGGILAYRDGHAAADAAKKYPGAAVRSLAYLMTGTGGKR